MSTAVIILITSILSFLPISELRGAIPFAIANNIPWYFALPFAVFINALISPACWIFLATVHKLLYGSSPEKGWLFYKNIFDRFIEKARNKLSAKVEKWGWPGISLFVAVPLPVTGAWTGTLGAWILGVSKKRTMLAVIIGVFTAGVIVTTVVVLGIEAFNMFIKKL
jgi:uncharacterized membrane protein